VLTVIIVVLLLSAKLKISDAISLNCSFAMETFSQVGNIYRCSASVAFDTEPEKITAVNGTHQGGREAGDVLGLQINSRRIEFFPTNIVNFFPNIIFLRFQSNSISYVNNYHLLPFPNLQYLSLYNNQITSLDSNLFSGLNSMRLISFQSNDIKHVGHDFILPDSGTITFTDNPCINLNAQTPAAIINLRFRLLVNCPPTISQIEHTLEDRPNLITNVSGKVLNLVERSDSLDRSHWEMEVELTNLTDLVTEFNGEIQSIIERTDGFEQRNLEIDAEVRNNTNLLITLSGEVQSIVRSYVEIDSQVQSVIERTNSLEERQYEIDVEFVSLTNLVQGFDVAIKNNTNFINNVNFEVETLVKSYSEIDSEIKILQNQNVVLEVRAAALENRATGIENRATGLETRAMFLEERVTHLETIIQTELGIKFEQIINENGKNEDEIEIY